MVKDGCGVFGVIRKPGAASISNLIAVSGISCINYRGSNLGAGYASIEGSQDPEFKILAFVRDETAANLIVEALADSFTSSAVRAPDQRPPFSLILPGDGKRSGILEVRLPHDLVSELELERKVDQINSALVTQEEKRFNGRIFSYGRHITVYKGVGYPLDVAKIYSLDRESKEADAWIAHTRQPTNSPGSSPIWSHPFASLDCAIVHNGDISSFGANLELLSSLGYKSHVGTDSEVIARLLNHLVRFEGLSIRAACTILTSPFEENIGGNDIKSLLISKYKSARLDGPFSVVASYSDVEDTYLIALVDRSKFRPLIVGEDEERFYVASEEVQIRNISRNARVWTPEPGSFFIASLKRGLIESGTTRDSSMMSVSFSNVYDGAKREDFANGDQIEVIDSTAMDFSEINAQIFKAYKKGASGIKVTNLAGQRYIGIGLSARERRFGVQLIGFPGNCLANLNDGGHFEIFGNAADDLGDTMHSGSIIVHGSSRDVTAQALQGGDIFIRGSVGNRAAIQMREYKESKPYLIVGESADDYFGEYMAGGVAVVLNLSNEKKPVGRYVGTGMVGGMIYIRGSVAQSAIGLPSKRDDVLNYLKAMKLDGVISEEQYNRILSADDLYHSEQALKEILPAEQFKRVKALFFRSKYTKPLYCEHRRLDENDLKYLSAKFDRFFSVFEIQEKKREVLESEFTVIRTIEEEEKETPIPPQEVPIEE
ncbi:MAG TPA: hypothetical protein VFF30_05740 [Nitrososphaerales archaeon]|nr:hypothetical protein [Nitrososphaerales archaeon]